jgi:CTP synthase
MSPFEHGECYVLSDGAECDLDLGNYERFAGINLSGAHNITTGQVYQEVIARERRGDFLGKTVQIVPHITNHIQERIEEASRIPVEGPDGTTGVPDVVIIEVGGSVGDMEGEPFFYQLSRMDFKKHCFYLHVALLVRNNGELKTKLIQDSVKKLNQRGITPDAVCVRCDIPSNELSPELRAKIKDTCGVENLLVSGLVNNIYEIPQLLQRQRIQEMVCQKLGLGWRGTMETNFEPYLKILEHWKRARAGELRLITVGIVAKYLETPDTYLSLTRALEHASFCVGCNLEIKMLDAEDFEALPEKAIPVLATVREMDAVVIPGGFGDRGITGKMRAITECRKQQIPLLGICLGLQLMVIEYVRNLHNQPDADSTEFNPDTKTPVVVHLSEYGDDLVKQLGGTMRLGDQQMRILPETRTRKVYGAEFAIDRSRHRFEVVPHFADRWSKSVNNTKEDPVLIVSAFGDSPTTKQVPECVEYTNCGDWWAIGTQNHPEYSSRNDRAHPLFVGLLQAALDNGKKNDKCGY